MPSFSHSGRNVENGSSCPLLSTQHTIRALLGAPTQAWSAHERFRYLPFFFSFTGTAATPAEAGVIGTRVDLASEAADLVSSTSAAPGSMSTDNSGPGIFEGESATARFFRLPEPSASALDSEASSAFSSAGLPPLPSSDGGCCCLSAREAASWASIEPRRLEAALGAAKEKGTAAALPAALEPVKASE